MNRADGYVATTRIEGVRPRLRAGRRRSAGGGIARDVLVAPRLIEDPDGDWSLDWIGDRLAAVRDAWSQTTFFLTDPNSWR